MENGMRVEKEEIIEIIDSAIFSKNEIYDSYVNRDVILEEKADDMLLVLITFMESYSLIKEVISLDNVIFDYDNLDDYTFRKIFIIIQLIKNEMKLLMKKLIRFNEQNNNLKKDINLQINTNQIVSIFGDWISEFLLQLQIEDDIGFDKKLEVSSQIDIWNKIFCYYSELLSILSLLDKKSNFDIKRK